MYVNYEHCLSILIACFVIFLGGCANVSPMQNLDAQKTALQALTADAGRGYGLYHQHCVTCHGKSLDGSDNGPALIHKIYRSTHHSDMSFFYAIRKGTRQHHWRFGDMPPVPGLSDQDVVDVTAYVRREQQKKGIQ